VVKCCNTDPVTSQCRVLVQEWFYPTNERVEYVSQVLMLQHQARPTNPISNPTLPISWNVIYMHVYYPMSIIILSDKWLLDSNTHVDKPHNIFSQYSIIVLEERLSKVLPFIHDKISTLSSFTWCYILMKMCVYNLEFLLSKC
jgi:hypothetical protein